ALADDLEQRLRETGHGSRVAATLADARVAVEEIEPDVVILDRLLPDGEGLELIPWLRMQYPVVAILVLSALVAIAARVDGLNAGADDYLGKPYAFEELLARIEALKRRRTEQPMQLGSGAIRLDRLARTVHAGDVELGLNPREFSLLEYLLLHSGETVTRAMILRDVWGYDFDPAANVVDVHVSRLRSKMEAVDCAGMLRTERKAGYRLVEPQEP
ncbi:MAG: response regulator transcription factor, partial [Gammaproteobacteria bacterium]|nr:response regulator transcription factor [Gammaproteobacteria bacterium]